MKLLPTYNPHLLSRRSHVNMGELLDGNWMYCGTRSERGAKCISSWIATKPPINNRWALTVAA